MIYVHDIKLPETNAFSKQFNICSDLWQKYQDETLTEEEREEHGKAWELERYRLETGGY